MIRAVPLSEPEAFRDARAEAWRFALACLAKNRRAKREGRPTTSGPDSPKGGSSDSSAKGSIP